MVTGNPQKCPESSRRWERSGNKNLQKWSTAGIEDPENMWKQWKNSKFPNNEASLRCLESFSSVSNKKTYLNTGPPSSTLSSIQNKGTHLIDPLVSLWKVFFWGPTVTYVACSKTMSPQMSQKATPPLRHRTFEHTPRRNHRPSDSDTTHETYVWNYEPPLYLDWWNTIYICICLGWCWKPSWTIRIVTKKLSSIFLRLFGKIC